MVLMLMQRCLLDKDTQMYQAVVIFIASVLEGQSEHPSVSHCGGSDHHAAGDARQGQHVCAQGRKPVPCLHAVLCAELSVHSECLAAPAGGERGRVHPGNHRLAAEELLGC